MPNQGREHQRIWRGILQRLTFLEHPIDRKAEHRFLKGKNTRAQDPA